MDLVVAGLPNKLIADQLDIQRAHGGVHRSRVFDKIRQVGCRAGQPAAHRPLSAGLSAAPELRWAHAHHKNFHASGCVRPSAVSLLAIR